nr:FAD-dependent monooxygenase [Streptoalloteichus tenebrarius]
MLDQADDRADDRGGTDAAHTDTAITATDTADTATTPDIADTPVALWPGAFAALEELCPRCEPLPRAPWPPGSGVFDRSGRLLVSFDPLVASGAAPAVLPLDEVRRGLLRALGPEHVVPSAQVIGVRETSTRVVVRCADGVDHLTGLVVAADGPRGVLGPEVDDRPRVRHLGATSWHGLLPPGRVRPEWHGEMWGRGEVFGVAPLPGGGLAWYAVAPTGDPGRDLAPVPHEWFARWPAPVPEILAAAEDHPPVQRPVEGLFPLPRRYVRGRIALLGDAARGASPVLGQGAGQALADAVILELALRAKSRLDEALAAYDQVRRPQANRAARRTWLAAALHRLRHPVAVDVRDGLLAHAPQWMIGRVVLRALGGIGS